MIKNIYLAGALSLVALASCTKNDPVAELYSGDSIGFAPSVTLEPQSEIFSNGSDLHIPTYYWLAEGEMKEISYYEKYDSLVTLSLVNVAGSTFKYVNETDFSGVSKEETKIATKQHDEGNWSDAYFTYRTIFNYTVSKELKIKSITKANEAADYLTDLIYKKVYTDLVFQMSYDQQKSVLVDGYNYLDETTFNSYFDEKKEGDEVTEEKGVITKEEAALLIAEFKKIPKAELLGKPVVKRKYAVTLNSRVSTAKGVEGESKDISFDVI